jgi:hypothetical protein
LVSPGRRKTIALFLYAKTAFDEQFLKEKMLFCPRPPRDARGFTISANKNPAFSGHAR